MSPAEGVRNAPSQPSSGLRDGLAIGVDAVLRLESPDGSVLPPDRFEAVAEKTGLIVAIGAGLVSMACEDLAAWRDADAVLRALDASRTSRTRLRVHLGTPRRDQPEPAGWSLPRSRSTKV